MTKVEFILSSVSNGWLFWSVNHTSMAWNSELNVFGKIWFFGEIFNELPNDLFGTNVYKTLESCWQSLSLILQWTNTTFAISKFGTFSPFLFLVILFSAFPSYFIVSGVNSRLYPVLVLNVIPFSILFTYILTVRLLLGIIHLLI